ncbi:hypothetical protein GCM10011344_27420 [Dokdonia pacifica]|uniref:RDD family protein n=1 Tax=Dokdonia pacifica TaxID=1627892 RepID=A0A239E4Q9_9FLAO|nr:RDD family protein [Dokdonia pacifica]GGG25266.1 hypothetical protein GCM10011344_27420 [Dokdonia pacifica]SNS39607.1 RDD family protein [Dokdonia pacifica]
MKIKYYLKRISAALIDVIIIAIIMHLYALIIDDSLTTEDQTIPTKVFLPFFYLYYIVSEIIFKTTLGKSIFSLKIKSEKKIIFFRIILRNIFNFLEIVLPFIYIIPLIITGYTTPKKPKKLGDIISGCYVA